MSRAPTFKRHSVKSHNSASIVNIRLYPEIFEKERTQFSRGDLINIRTVSNVLAEHLRAVIAPPTCQIDKVVIGGNDWYSVCYTDNPARLPRLDYRLEQNFPRRYVFSDCHQALTTGKLTDLELVESGNQCNSIVEENDTPQKLFVFPWFKTEWVQNYEIERRSNSPHVFLTYSNGFVRIYQLILAASSYSAIQLPITSVPAESILPKYPHDKKYVLAEISRSSDKNRPSFRIPIAYRDPFCAFDPLQFLVESPARDCILEFANNYSHKCSKSKSFPCEPLDVIKIRGNITRQTARLWEYYYDLDYLKFVS